MHVSAAGYIKRPTGGKMNRYNILDALFPSDNYFYQIKEKCKIEKGSGLFVVS